MISIVNNSFNFSFTISFKRIVVFASIFSIFKLTFSILTTTTSLNYFTSNVIYQWNLKTSSSFWVISFWENSFTNVNKWTIKFILWKTTFSIANSTQISLFLTSRLIALFLFSLRFWLTLLSLRLIIISIVSNLWIFSSSSQF